MSALGIPEPRLPLPTWQVMSEDRYAAFAAATRVNVARIGGIWWRRVRPFLYRPLLPFKKYDLAIARDGFNKIGVFQNAVKDGQSSNSYLNPILFDRLPDYDASKLRDNVRGSLKKAMRSSITVCRIADEEQFCEMAYPVYLSFYKRTKYRFDNGRQEKSNFKKWAHILFQFSEAAILGAFAAGQLVSFEITCLVENTLILKTIVTSDLALKLNTPDLLLHYYRTAAAGRSDIHHIYDSMVSENGGLNRYKIMRGAKAHALPAYLHINPALLWLCKKAHLASYDRLCGLNDEQLVARGLS